MIIKRMDRKKMIAVKGRGLRSQFTISFRLSFVQDNLS
jgi:hypothetical protein